MKAFFNFGYGNIERQFQTYHPAVQAHVLVTLPRAGRTSYWVELFLFVLVWFLRAYWLLMVAWFFHVEQNLQLQILSIPLFLCSLAMAYGLGVIVRSGSVLHIFFAVVGTLTAGGMM